jgi:hypothetical protein
VIPELPELLEQPEPQVIQEIRVIPELLDKQVIPEIQEIQVI